MERSIEIERLTGTPLNNSSAAAGYAKRSARARRKRSVRGGEGKLALSRLDARPRKNDINGRSGTPAPRGMTWITRNAFREFGEQRERIGARWKRAFQRRAAAVFRKRARPENEPRL